MKNFFNNIGYFLKEVKIMIRLNLISNLLSIFSTALIFFILGMVITGWWASNRIVETIKGEAEISVYFDKSIGIEGATQLAEKLKSTAGVRDARIVDENEAYKRMEDILGKEAHVLEFFDDNPFSPFIEVKINLEEIKPVLGKLENMAGVEHVRDNMEVLERIKNLAALLQFLGYMVATAVGISTLVIISHIIRLGIYNSREQINTLRLLGAPETFIAFPFLLEGLLLTICGGLLAAALAAFTINAIYLQVAGPLPFIPLPPKEALVSGMSLVVVTLSAVLGVVGSLVGLATAKSS